MRAIYWFKRDLRLDDNRALAAAVNRCSELIPIFIFDPDLLDDFNSRNQKLGFILDALRPLATRIRLYCFYEKTETVFDRLIHQLKPDAIYTARAFSWQGEKRDETVRQIAERNRVRFQAVPDNFLADFTQIPFTRVFSHFFRRWQERLDLGRVTVRLDRISIPRLELPDLDRLLKQFPELDQPNRYWQADQADSRLTGIDFENYSRTRDRLDIAGPSRLSPYIRFGIISVRELYRRAVPRSPTYVRELAWREFWYHIKYHFPELNRLEFQERRRRLRWGNNEKWLRAFLEARTGYPLIDAALIQLRTENWLHNRLRMILASFLTKDLLIDWRHGERFFRQQLLDYDEVANTGNWQWCASVGPDPRPLRVFNPLLQAQRYDPDCRYIRTWLPELRDADCAARDNPLRYRLNYHPPIVNHYQQLHLIRSIYKTRDEAARI
ncbi:MAG: deoxyribodipyrimidine photo-lyase [candidate division WOR-3 bacterium]